MHEKHRKILGLSSEKYLDEKCIMQNYRKKINESTNDLVKFSESALILMQSCRKDFTGLKFLDEVFFNMLGNASNDNGTMTMNIRGFKTLAHNGMFTILNKKFGKNEGTIFEPDHCEIPLNYVRLPNDRTGLPHNFPPVKIFATSTLEGFKFEIKGESAILFVLFHMKQIITQFVKQIPVPIEDCYTTPAKQTTIEDKNLSSSSSSLDSSDSSDNESNEIVVTPPPSETPPSSPSPLPSPKPRLQTCQLSPSSPRPSPSPPPSPVFHSNKRNTRRVMSSQHISIPPVTSPQSPSFPASNPDHIPANCSKETATMISIEAIDDQCVDCTLIDVGINIENIVSEDGFKMNSNCLGKCLDECKDSTRFLIDRLWKFSCKTKLLDVDSMDPFKRNMKMVIKVFDTMPKGAPGFYCHVLDFLSSISQHDQDRFMSILRAIIDDCLTDQFETVIINERNARRNLSDYLSKTGSILCFQLAIETLHRMFLKGVDLKKILPSSLENLPELFSSASFIQNNIAYHYFMTHVCRDVLKNVYQGKNIDCFKVDRKMYKLGEETLEISGDNFLYVDKVNSLFQHFLFLDNGVFADKIHFNNVHLLEESLISTPKWNFYLDCDMSLVGRLGIKQNECKETPIQPEETKGVDDSDDSDISETCNVNREPEFSNHSDSSNDKYFDNDGDDGESNDTQVAHSKITVKASDILQYWDAKPNKRRKFVAGMVGADWPKMYGSPCAVVIDKYNHVKVVGSQKRSSNFAKVKGTCKICAACHIYQIENNPFEESITKDNVVAYKPVKDMSINVTVIGRFDLTEDDMPDVTKPKHDLKKSAGLHLKGRARELVANRATNVGTKSTYLEQLDYADDHQIKYGNKTSVKSIPVIKQARLEEEKKSRGGKNYYEAALHVFESQSTDISPNFEDTAISRKFPGLIRSLQQIPFKMIISNFDQLKIGSAYLNKSKNSLVHMDSSGKFLKPKGGKKLLNTALVIPPPAPGHAPFPIMELISETNKTIDYKMFMELGWSYLSSAIGDEPVAFPKNAVTDMSFPNIHSLLSVFNRVKLSEYLESCYRSFTRNQKMEHETIITLCENHLTPAFLKTARTSGTEKVIADTFVAGFMLVLRARTIAEALDIWNNLVTIYGSKQETEEVKSAMESVKKTSKPITDGTDSGDSYFYDFEDETTKEEELSYGNRKLLRVNSPFYKLFKRPADKMKDNQKGISVSSNRFHAPNLLDLMAKQYLSLFPLISASVLEDGLVTNTHVELYWKEQRRLIKHIPDRLLWPPYYLGNLHSSLRREAKNFLLHNRIPTLKYGGKIKPGQDLKFHEFVEDSAQKKEGNIFRPTPSKSQKRKRKVDETFGGCQEEWNSQKKRTQKKKRYMKGKVLDFAAVMEDMDPPAPDKDIIVTGTRKGLGEESVPITTAPQAIVLTSEDINFISTENLYISTDAVDAGLSLLDRKLNEESELDVTVYTTQNCRVIFTGDNSLVKNGSFLTIIPRYFAISEEGARLDAKSTGKIQNESCGHFTLVSNLHCGPEEVNVYETFGPFRDPESLLTPNGKILLKSLCNSENLKVNCINVKEQEESECGAIAVALAVNLCFFAPSEEALFRRIIDVRKLFLDCMKHNSLTYFKMAPRQKVDEDSKVIFSINI